MSVSLKREICCKNTSNDLLFVDISSPVASSKIASSSFSIKDCKLFTNSSMLFILSLFSAVFSSFSASFILQVRTISSPNSKASLL